MDLKKSATAYLVAAWIGLALALESAPPAKAEGIVDGILNGLKQAAVNMVADAVEGRGSREASPAPSARLAPDPRRQTIVILPTRDVRGRYHYMWNPDPWVGQFFAIWEDHLCEQVTSSILVAFGQTGRWNVSDVRMTNEIKRLQDEYASDRYDPQIGVRIGKLFGAQRAVVTEVTYFVATTIGGVDSKGSVSTNSKLVESTIKMNVWMVDLERGVIQTPFEVTGRERAIVGRVKVGSFFRNVGVDWAQSPAGKATKAAAEKAAKLVGRSDSGPVQVLARQFSVRSVDKSRGRIYLSGGSADGVTVGDEFVVPAGEEITDENGEVLGYQAELIARVVRVTDKLAECQIVGKPEVWPTVGAVASPKGAKAAAIAPQTDSDPFAGFEPLRVPVEFFLEGHDWESFEGKPLTIFSLDGQGRKSVVKGAPVCLFGGQVSENVWGVWVPKGARATIKDGLEKKGWLFGPATGR